jgi:hypothetical protein
MHMEHEDPHIHLHVSCNDNAGICHQLITTRSRSVERYLVGQQMIKDITERLSVFLGKIMYDD